jgi:arylsulfatase A-like enzyme
LVLGLVLLRAGAVLGMELAHHADLQLAWLRLEQIRLTLFLGAAVLAAAGGFAAGLLATSRSGRWLLHLALTAAGFLFLAGRFDGDRSRRVGADTTVGVLALAALLLTVAVFAAAFVWGRPRALMGRFAGRARDALAPGTALLLVAAALAWAFRGLGESMVVEQIELELTSGGWETLRAHPDSPPAAGCLAPSLEYTLEGAARPTLVLAPPALVRRTCPEFEGPRWLVGGVAVDQSVAAEAAEHYAGHSVRFRVTSDGREASTITLPLRGVTAWHELGDGQGLALRAGTRLELQTELLDPSGHEVRPELPILAGFGGLGLEQRERRPRTRSSSEATNIVLVLIDTLRADRCSAYGYGRATTPHLDALARRGVLLEEACATASWTWPSTASILTGLQPEQHGVEDASSSFLGQPLDTLAEALQRAGFTTAAWSGSPLIVPDKGFSQGFEFFDASREGRLRRSDLIVPPALDWLGTARGTRFFLYLHLMEPHAPFQPLAGGRAQFAPSVPRDYDPRKVLDYNWDLQREGFDGSGTRRTASVVPEVEQRWISDLYDGCVWSADHYLGLLLARLEELGLTDQTIVAVTSDHGEELFEHGLVTHGSTLHRELVRVPLVLAGPGLPRGERVAGPRSLAALGPTLARLGGAELAGPSEPLDLLAPEADDCTLFSTRQGWWNGYARQPIFGLRQGAQVLHFAPAAAPWGGTQPGPGELRLYDLARDPQESTDVAARESERARAMKDELMRRLSVLRKRRVTIETTPDPGTIERLQGLGYNGE